MAMAYYATSTSTWQTWCDATTSATTATTITDPWTVWTSTTTTATCDPWTTWIFTFTGTTVTNVSARRIPQVTQAELQALRDRNDALARQHAEAEARAEALLIEHLSAKQRDEFRQHRHFTVHGRNHRYRVRKGRMGNVDVIDARGIITHRLCAHPGLAVPDYDTMLAQKLMLECEEDAFLKVANRHAPRNSNERVLEAA